jgi:hypothetical protein
MIVAALSRLLDVLCGTSRSDREREDSFPLLFFIDCVSEHGEEYAINILSNSFTLIVNSAKDYIE